MLKNQSHTATARIQRKQILAISLYGSCIRMIQTRKNAQQTGFPRAGGTEHGHEFALGDGEVNVVQRNVGAELATQAGNLDTHDAALPQ
jgi:hypothetical protein